MKQVQVFLLSAEAHNECPTIFNYLCPLIIPPSLSTTLSLLSSSFSLPPFYLSCFSFLSPLFSIPCLPLSPLSLFVSLLSISFPHPSLSLFPFFSLPLSPPFSPFLSLSHSRSPLLGFPPPFFRSHLLFLNLARETLETVYPPLCLTMCPPLGNL